MRIDIQGEDGSNVFKKVILGENKSLINAIEAIVDAYLEAYDTGFEEGEQEDDSNDRDEGTPPNEGMD